MRSLWLRPMSMATVLVVVLSLANPIGLRAAEANGATEMGTASSDELVTRLVVYYRSARARIAKGGALRTAIGATTKGTVSPTTIPPMLDSKRPLSPSVSSAVLGPATSSAYTESVVVELPQAMTLEQARVEAARLQRDPDVHAVLVDRATTLTTLNTNDDMRGYLWNLWSNAGNPAAAGSSRTEPVWGQYRGSGVTIAVLDSGRLAHEDMAGVWTDGYDMITDAARSLDGDGRDNDPSDVLTCQSADKRTPHGLMVASVIAARHNNGLGIAGVAPEARIMPIRVLSACYGGTVYDLLDGMRWAVGLPVNGVPTNPTPARILNLSLGSSGGSNACDPVIQSVIDEVLGTGATIVVATGNEGRDQISIPASCSGVVAVSASTRDARRANYSNVGVGTTIAAPGGGCVSGASECTIDNAIVVASQSSPAVTGGIYGAGQGTSFATPHVAGAVALLLQSNASLTPQGVRSKLVNAAREFAPGVCDNGLCGVGMLDVEAAMAIGGFTLDATVSSSNVRAGDTVVLQAHTGSEILAPTFIWEQTAGASVTLSYEAGNQIARFTAPSVSQVLSFKVTATDASSLRRIAIVSTHVSVEPVLVSIPPTSIYVGAPYSQSLRLTTGGTPVAAAIDAASEALGFVFGGGVVRWQDPVAGAYVVTVTPYDSVGAGVPLEIGIDVKINPFAATGDSDGKQNVDDSNSAEATVSAGGGGGALGLHGMLLLMLAFIARRRFDAGA